MQHSGLQQIRHNVIGLPEMMFGGGEDANPFAVSQADDDIDDAFWSDNWSDYDNADGQSVASGEGSLFNKFKNVITGAKGLASAPVEVVQQQRERFNELNQQIAKKEGELESAEKQLSQLVVKDRVIDPGHIPFMDAEKEVRNELNDLKKQKKRLIALMGAEGTAGLAGLYGAKKGYDYATRPEPEPKSHMMTYIVMLLVLLGVLWAAGVFKPKKHRGGKRRRTRKASKGRKTRRSKNRRR